MEKKINVALVVAALSIAAFMVPIDITVANVAIPYITGDMGAEAAQGKSIITSYFIGEAIGISFANWLTKRMGDVRLFMMSILLFVLFSFICGNVLSLPMLIIFRFFQGLASGPILPLTQSLLYRFVVREKFFFFFALANMCFISGTMFGPLLGGIIVTHWGWPWIFNINVPIGILIYLILWKELRGYNLPPKKEPCDWVGLCLVALTVVSLQIFLDTGHDQDWFHSSFIRFFAFIALISFIAGFFYEIRHSNPFLELRFFKKPIFAVSSLLMWLTVAVDLASFIILSLWLQVYNNYNALWAGFSAAPYGAGALLFAAMGPLLIKRLGGFGVVALGSMIGACTFFYQATLFTSDIDFHHLLLPRFLCGGGIMLIYFSLTLLSKQGIEHKDIPSALGLVQFSRSILAAVGTTLFVTFWQRNTIVQHENLVTHLPSTDPSVKNYLALFKKLGFTHEQSLSQLNTMTDIQASTLAFDNTLYFMGYVFIIITLIALLNYKRGKIELSLN